MALAPTRSIAASIVSSTKHRVARFFHRDRPAIRSKAPDSFQPSTQSPLDKLRAESAATIAGNRGLGDIEAQLARIKALDQPGPRREITIIGSGMSALAAAYELEKLGHHVRILEGSDRIGGRVWTKRFADGTYHELGAMRIPKSHDYTRHYIKELGLKLRHFVTIGDEPDAFYDIAGVDTPMKDAKARLYPKFDLTDADRAAESAPAILDQHLNRLIDSLSEKEKLSLFSTELASDRLKKLDETPMKQWLAQREGPDAIQLIGSTTGIDAELDRPVTVYLREQLRHIGEGLEEVVGGMDQLPNGIAARLKAQVELNTKLLGINVREDGKTELTLSKNGGPPTKEVVGGEVLVTLPFSVLRGVDTQGFSRGKEKAIREMSYASATKVLLDTSERFWESKYQIFGGASHSDSIIGATYYPSDNAEKQDPNVEAGPGVLVGSYVWGADARRLGAMTPEDRVNTVIHNVARFHPEIEQPGMVKDAASISWDENPWTRGAYGSPTLGQASLYKDGIRQEGRVHFAGEHLSYDPGWIQGALISSLRAVEEIVTAPRSQDTK